MPLTPSSPVNTTRVQINGNDILTNESVLYLRSASSSSAALSLLTGSAPRFTLRKSGDETGSNAGGDLTFERYDDAGTGYVAVRISRASGLVTMPGGVATGAINPQVDNLYAIGAAAQRFSSAFFTTARIGNATDVALSGVAGSALQLSGTSAISSSANLIRTSADGGCAFLTLAKSRGSTPGTYTAVQSGDLLGTISYQGADGTGMAIGAQIVAIANEAYSTSARGTKLRFLAVADGAAAASNSIEVTATTLQPAADNVRTLGTGSLRWSVVYAATGAISTSDARTKQQIELIPDEWLDAWGGVRHVRFKFNDAVEEKGEAARWHVGYVAQEIRDAFADQGIDATLIGLLCHDIWDMETEPEYRTEIRTEIVPRAVINQAGLVDENGTPLIRWIDEEVQQEVQVATGEVIVTREAGDLWSIRPDECAAMEAAWMRREIARLKESLPSLSS